MLSTAEKGHLMKLRYVTRMIPADWEGSPYDVPDKAFDTWPSAQAHAEAHAGATGDGICVDLYEYKPTLIDDPDYGPVSLEGWEITEFYAEYFDGDWLIDYPQYGEVIT